MDQTLLDVAPGVGQIQRAQAIGKGDALAQLTEFGALEQFVEFRLAEQHHLQQLAVLGFQVGQQTQGLEGFLRQGLGFVDQQHGALALGRQFDQPVVERRQQAVVVQLVGIGDVQLNGQRLAQAARAEARIGQPGDLPALAVRAEGIEQGAAQQGLAGADLAADLDETFALAQRHAQQVEAGLIGGQPHQERGVGGQREGFFAQAEEALIHAPTSARGNWPRSSAARRSRCRRRSPADAAGSPARCAPDPCAAAGTDRRGTAVWTARARWRRCCR
ncbi:hypothetical protein D9M71_241080 [compost metagenome]